MLVAYTIIEYTNYLCVFSDIIVAAEPGHL